MRIETDSIEAFLENVEDGAMVFNNRIYVQKSKRSMTADSLRDATSVSVILQASAVLFYEDTSQALVECGFECGIDRYTSDGTQDGTKVYDQCIMELRKFCDERGLKLRPGILGE